MAKEENMNEKKRQLKKAENMFNSIKKMMDDTTD